jgi:hypothetical protein
MSVLGNGTADGTNIEQQTHQRLGQIYRFQNQGRRHKILHVASGRYVSPTVRPPTTTSSSSAPPAPRRCSRFNVVARHGIYYNLVNRRRQLPRRLHASTANGGQYETYTCNGGTNRAFSFVSP